LKMLFNPACMRPNAAVRSWYFTNTIRFGVVRDAKVFASGNCWKGDFPPMSSTRSRRQNRSLLPFNNIWPQHRVLIRSCLDPARDTCQEQNSSWDRGRETCQEQNSSWDRGRDTCQEQNSSWDRGRDTCQEQNSSWDRGRDTCQEQNSSWDRG